jgi:hypothetical protein
MSYPLTTNEFARLIGVQGISVRIHTYKSGGSYFGIKPEKLPNGRLLWPADAPERLRAMKR